MIMSCNTGNRLTIVMIGMILTTCTQCAVAERVNGNQKSEAQAAASTLRHYVQLRLNNADWSDYSKYITWPDEPSWDCNWVVRRYSVGTGRDDKGEVTIPVQYERIGLFCYDFAFKPGMSRVTVSYELIKTADGWKVNGPVPDYPDISANTLLEMLRASAHNTDESPGRREDFSAAAHKIASMLSSATKVK